MSVAAIPDAVSLRLTPLHDEHVAAGARMVPFAGWSMPIQYVDGVLAEHRAVRRSAGLFDVSHMGQVFISGVDAERDLQHLLSNDLRKLDVDGAAQYTLLTNEQGGIEDDLIAYRMAPESYLLVVNASNLEHDVAIVRAGITSATRLVDASNDWAMLALQGPCAGDALRDACGVDLNSMPPFRLLDTEWNGQRLLVATTGYTGERGCELLVPAAAAVELWRALACHEAVTRVGLGARDTLRLEACYPLHGNDIAPDIDAVTSGLGWACGWGTGFVGEPALEAVRDAGPVERLVALRATERGIPRAGQSVFHDGARVGTVTSGTMSPSLGDGIALAYVRTDLCAPGTDLTVDVRGRSLPVVVTKKPLYSHGS